MIVLLDTDILIDVALNRAPFAEDASRLLDLLEARPGKAWVAWHSISNFYYLVSPTLGRQSAREFVLELMQFTRIAPTDTESLLYACRLEMSDFEDAMQVAAAVACRAAVISTRNLRHYAKSPIPAKHPQAVVEELLS